MIVDRETRNNTNKKIFFRTYFSELFKIFIEYPRIIT